MVDHAFKAEYDALAEELKSLVEQLRSEEPDAEALSDGEQALSQVAAWWQGVPKSVFSPFSPETEAQADFVRQWAEPPLPLP